jgi:hypothetical protein
VHDGRRVAEAGPRAPRQVVQGIANHDARRPGPPRGNQTDAVVTRVARHSGCLRLWDGIHQIVSRISFHV